MDVASSSIDRRLRHLEIQLGLDNNNSKDATAAVSIRDQADISTRIEALKRCYCPGIHNNPKQQQQQLITTLWNEIDTLMEELSPGTALTHQKQIVAPILYRREEILASATSLATDMQHVSQIMSLLTISSSSAPSPAPLSSAGTTTTTSHNATTGITEQQVIQAPILTMNDDSTATALDQRLDVLVDSVVALQDRINQASTKLDHILDNYSSLVSAVSEKLVLADEEISSRKRGK